MFRCWPPRTHLPCIVSISDTWGKIKVKEERNVSSRWLIFFIDAASFDCRVAHMSSHRRSWFVLSLLSRFLVLEDVGEFGSSSSESLYCPPSCRFWEGLDISLPSSFSSFDPIMVSTLQSQFCNSEGARQLVSQTPGWCEKLWKQHDWYERRDTQEEKWREFYLQLVQFSCYGAFSFVDFSKSNKFCLMTLELSLALLAITEIR
jgi:hypothetical protein